jgi:hypothetical protein
MSIYQHNNVEIYFNSKPLITSNLKKQYIFAKKIKAIDYKELERNCNLVT